MLICTPDGFFNGPDIEFASLAEAQADRLAHIEVAGFQARERIVRGTHPSEMASWSLKLAEAQAGGGPLLQTEADARGVPVSALVAKVQANAASLAMAEAAIAGTAGRHRDAIAAMTTIEDVAAYDFSAGWPTA